MASVSKVVESLEKELECPICLEMFTDPKTLPCLHTYCCQCLNELAEKRKNDEEPIPCPDCRTETKLPRGGSFSAFPSAFYLNRLRDIVLCVNRQESQVPCRSCGNQVPKVAFCFDCACFICAECGNLHSKLLITRGHRMSAFDKIQDADIQEILRVPQRCPQKYHEDAALQYFCKTCQECVCQICTTILHKDHELMHLKVAADEVKPMLDETENKVKAQADIWAEKMSTERDKHRRLKEQTDACRSAIRQNTQRYIELVQRHENVLLSELDTLLDEQNKKFQSQTEEAELFLGQLKSISEYLHNVSQRAISEELLKALPRALSRTQEVFDAIAQFPLLEDVFVEFQTDEEVCKNVAETPVGRINIQLGQRTQEGKDFGRIHKEKQDGRDNVHTFTLPVQEQSPPYMEKNLAVLEDDKQDTLFTPNETKPPSGYTPVTTISYYGGGGREQMKGPAGVSVSRLGELAVTDHLNHRIELFKADGERLSCFGTRGSGPGQLNYPRGLAWADKERHVIVADQCNSRIQKFNCGGEFLQQFGQGVLKEPCGLLVTSRGDVVVCDSKGKKLCIFDSEGRLLHQFGTQAQPMHVTFWDDKYFVTSNNHVVKVFDTLGSHLYDIGTEGSGDGQFKSPRGLAIGAGGVLLVCDHGNHRVQVFKSDGEFVTSFGSRGSGEGQFNRPQDIAVSRDGRVFVTDFGNHRIQVFHALYE